MASIRVALQEKGVALDLIDIGQQSMITWNQREELGRNTLIAPWLQEKTFRDVDKAPDTFGAFTQRFKTQLVEAACISKPTYWYHTKAK